MILTIDFYGCADFKWLAVKVYLKMRQRCMLASKCYY